MYATDIARAAVKAALEARGFSWPEASARDKDSVLARTMAFDALRSLTGMSRRGAAIAVGVTGPAARDIEKRTITSWPQRQARDEWIMQVRDTIIRMVAAQSTAKEE